MFSSDYYRSVCDAMNMLAAHSRTIFLGQQVGVQDFYGTLENVPTFKRIEMPIAEELQLGMSIGLALERYIPVCIYQRMDFLPRAADQIVNHLDLIEDLSHGLFKPKVIIRVTVGSKKPLDVGIQHNKDLANMFKGIVSFPVHKVYTPDDVKTHYHNALNGNTSYMIIEYQDLYK